MYDEVDVFQPPNRRENCEKAYKIFSVDAKTNSVVYVYSTRYPAKSGKEQWEWEAHMRGEH